MKKIPFLKLLTLGLAMLVFETVYAQKENYPYQNPRLPAEERVNDLLSRMTLEEKVGQLSMKSLSDLRTDEKGNVTAGSLEESFGGKVLVALKAHLLNIPD